MSLAMIETLPGLERLYDLYSFNLVPLLGRWVAKDEASYRYLVESIRRFPDQPAFAALMGAAGLEQVRWRNLSGGIAAVSGAGAELWAVGSAGALVHWNGASWDSIETGTRRDFYSIFLGAQKQWIAGDLGTLLSKSR